MYSRNGLDKSFETSRETSKETAIDKIFRIGRKVWNV